MPDLVIISPNDPVAMLNLAEECRKRSIRFVFDPSQQLPRFDRDEIRRGLEGAFALVVNAYEGELICNKTGMTIDDLRREISILVITQGKNGSHIYTDGQRIEVPIVPVNEIKDPTGVGDAYRAGLVCGIAHGWSLKLAGEVGALCAAYVLEQVGTQSHRFTLPEFIARFRQQFDDQGQLDRLLESTVKA
jgi:adenosine kinase